ncbi:MAG TPA: hypothetical protein VML55_01840 [Planctomycetaceae bacterium]|nr:hypothetical protein [Planctomycetaceae bacterium]
MTSSFVLLAILAVSIAILVVAIVARSSRDPGNAALLGTIAHALGLVTLAGSLAVVIPWFKKLFEDFDVELSSPTIVLIHVSDWFLRSSGMALLAMGVVAGITSSAYLHSRFCSEPESALLARRVSFWASIALAGLVLAPAAMLAMPMVKLLNDLS